LVVDFIHQILDQMNAQASDLAFIQRAWQLGRMLSTGLKAIPSSSSTTVKTLQSVEMLTG